MVDTFEENEINNYDANLILKDILSNINHGVIGFDKTGDIFLWNDYMANLTGYKLSEVKGSKIWDIQYNLMPHGYRFDDKVELVRNYIEFILENNEPEVFNKPLRLMIRNKLSKEIYVEQRLKYINSGPNDYLLSFVKNINDLIALENDLQILDKTLGEAIHYTHTIHYKQNFITGKYEYISKFVEELLGYTIAEIDELITKDLMNFIHPDDIDNYKKEHVDLRNIDFISEYRFKTKKGDYKYLSDYHRLIYDKENEPAYIIGNIRDITLQKQFEAELEESREQYKLLVESISDMFVTTDFEGNISYASPNYLKLFGFNNYDVIGKKFTYTIHEDDKYKDEIANEQLVSPPYSCSCEHRAFTNYGWRWLEWSKKSIFDENNNIKIIISVGRDITKKKRMEAALKKSEHDYKNLFEMAMSAIVIFDPLTEIILDANQNACDLYEFDKSEFVGMSLEYITKDIQKGKIEISKTLNLENNHRFETVHFTKTGKELIMEINASVIDFADSKAILSVNNDITKYRTSG